MAIGLGLCGYRTAKVFFSAKRGYDKNEEYATFIRNGRSLNVDDAISQKADRNKPTLLIINGKCITTAPGSRHIFSVNEYSRDYIIS